jgi:hypothetical protein
MAGFERRLDPLDKRKCGGFAPKKIITLWNLRLLDPAVAVRFDFIRLLWHGARHTIGSGSVEQNVPQGLKPRCYCAVAA